MESTHTDPEGYQQEMDYSTGSEDDEDGEPSYGVKMELAEDSTVPQANIPAKQTISSIIDNPDEQSRETLSSMPPLNDSTNQFPEYQGHVEKPQFGGSPQSEKENSAPKRSEPMS